MTYRTHNIFGFASLLAVFSYWPVEKLGWATIMAGLIANAIGSILPDIDQGSNKLWMLLPGGNAIGRILRNMFIAHRSVSHSIIGTYVAFKFIVWLTPLIFNNNFINVNLIITSLMIGCISHIAIDGITEEGVPLLWPIRWKFGIPPIRSWRIKTGKWFEKLVVFPAIIIFIAWNLYSNYSNLIKIF